MRHFTVWTAVGGERFVSRCPVDVAADDRGHLEDCVTLSCEARRKNPFNVILGQGNICPTALERWAKSTQNALEIIDFR